jgi:hypothetical protein
MGGNSCWLMPPAAPNGLARRRAEEANIVGCTYQGRIGLCDSWFEFPLSTGQPWKDRTSRSCSVFANRDLNSFVAIHSLLDLGFYRFSYNGSDKTYVGVMAQEVEAICLSNRNNVATA